MSVARNLCRTKHVLQTVGSPGQYDHLQMKPNDIPHEGDTMTNLQLEAIFSEMNHYFLELEIHLHMQPVSSDHLPGVLDWWKGQANQFQISANLHAVICDFRPLVLALSGLGLVEGILSITEDSN